MTVTPEDWRKHLAISSPKTTTDAMSLCQNRRMKLVKGVMMEKVIVLKIVAIKSERHAMSLCVTNTIDMLISRLCVTNTIDMLISRLCVTNTIDMLISRLCVTNTIDMLISRLCDKYH